jgi:hypothetical protein
MSPFIKKIRNPNKMSGYFHFKTSVIERCFKAQYPEN